MSNLISKITRGSRWLHVFVSALMLAGILFSVVPVYAANYIDTFTPDPLAGGYADVVNTGTAATGLTYTFTGDGDGGGGIGFAIQTSTSPSNALEPRSAAYNLGTTERITIVSRDGNSFTFNDIWIDINPSTGGSGFTITGIGPEPFTITTGAPGTSGTYAPTGGSKLVTSVEITSVDFYQDWIDDVDVDIDLSGMGVYGNGILIVNGDNTPVSTDDTYFGSTPAGTPLSKTFTISSIGDSSLDLTGSPYVTVSGSTDITVTSQPTTDPITSGGSDTFTVQCNPSGAGNQTATLNINNNSEANPYTFNVRCTGTVDTTPPGLTSFALQIPATSPTNADTLIFRATFDESVQNVTAGDFSVSASTAGITGVNQISASIYDVTVSGGNLASFSGTVGLDLASGQDIQDLAGNALPTSEPGTDETYLVDNIDPSIPTGLLPADISYTNDTTPTLSWNASTDTGGSGLRTTDTYRVVVNGTPSRDYYTANTSYTPTLAEGVFTWHVYARDNAGNTSAWSSLYTLNIDTTAPDVTINQASTQDDPTNSSPVIFTAVFDEPINDTTFTDTDVNVGGTATTGTVTVTEIFPNDGTTFSVSVVVSSEGTVTATIPAGGVEDLAGNTNTISTSTDNSIVYDTTQPDVTINQASTQVDPATSSPIVFTAIFDEPINDTTFTDTDVTIGGTATTGTVTISEIAPNDGTTFSVSVVVSGDGIVTATIPSGGIEDLAGNTNTISTSTDNQITFDGNPEIDMQRPAATSIADSGTDALGNQTLGTVNLTYTVDNTAGTDILTVTGVTASSLANVSNFSLDTTVPMNVAGGSSATFDISFDIGVNGSFSFDMEIANNDASEATYNIAVSGTGTGGAPEIDIQRPASTSIADSASDNIGSPGIGVVTLTYTIDNSAGTEQLSVTNVTAANLTNISGFTLNTATPINITAGSTGTFEISFTINAAGAFSFDMDITSNDADETTYDILVNGTAADLVVLLGGNTSPLDGDILSAGPSVLSIQFNKEIQTGAGLGSGENPANYLLIEAGSNNTFDTISCPSGVLSDDTNITIDSINYNSITHTATLNINGGTALADGSYRLFACGTTSIEDLFGNELNNGLSDARISFTLQSAPSALPETGFRHGRVTSLPKQPAAKAYTSTAMTLEIPKLGVSMPIVGVPQSENGWDVTWLGNSAGYLAGSAFPTWAGNTVITGHVWDANNQPGIFAELKTLSYGDQVQIRAWGETYTYEVRESKLVTVKNVNAAFQSEEYDWLTLVTCEFYNPFTGDYLFRRAVKAVLISVQ